MASYCPKTDKKTEKKKMIGMHQGEPTGQAVIFSETDWPFQKKMHIHTCACFLELFFWNGSFY